MGKVFQWTLIVSLAGILFGFDTVVISGVDQQLQSLWGSSDVFHGFVVMSSALWGTVIGAIFAWWPSRKIGRKNSLIAIAILYLLSALGSSLTNDPFLFAFFRFIGGLGVGASTIAAPAYISEISPANKRGRLVALYQLSIVLGVLLAMVSNYLLVDLGNNAWRMMLGAEAIPALVFLLLIITVPKSPRWLIDQNRREEAEQLILKYQLELNVEQILKQTNSDRKESIFDTPYRKSLFLVILIAVFNQLSGINAILYYAPRIFEASGLDQSNSFLAGIWIGLINLIFTLLGMALIDKYGRKQLLLIGSLGYILSLGGTALAFAFDWDAYLVLFLLLFFIASHAVGQGAVIWVFIAEIFPTHLRGAGQSLGSSVHWVLAAFIPALIPMLFSSIGASFVFAAFSFFMVLQLVWVIVKMPETKGKELEELNLEINS